MKLLSSEELFPWSRIAKFLQVNTFEKYTGEIISGDVLRWLATKERLRMNKETYVPTAVRKGHACREGVSGVFSSSIHTHVY